MDETRRVETTLDRVRERVLPAAADSPFYAADFFV